MFDQPSKRKQRGIYIYICGDFNFDLLKVDSDHITQHFYNLLCSYGFLPHILQPTSDWIIQQQSLIISIATIFRMTS